MDENDYDEEFASDEEQHDDAREAEEDDEEFFGDAVTQPEDTEEEEEDYVQTRHDSKKRSRSTKSSPGNVKLTIKLSQQNADEKEDKHKKKKKKHSHNGRPTEIGAMCNVIDELFKADQSRTFWSAVDTTLVPNYLEVIKHPMDLSTLKFNLSSAKYKSTKHFLHDLERIFKNCTEFNPSDSIYYKEAKRLSKLSKNLTKDVDKEGRIVPHAQLPLGDDEKISARKKGMVSIVDELKTQDKSKIFHEPVTILLQDYFNIINRPLDLSTLRHMCKKNRIPTLGAFMSDLEIIFNNSIKFNPSSSIFHKEAKRLLKLSQEKVNKLSQQIKEPIQQQQQQQSQPTVATTPTSTTPSSSRPSRSSIKRVVDDADDVATPSKRQPIPKKNATPSSTTPKPKKTPAQEDFETPKKQIQPVTPLSSSTDKNTSSSSKKKKPPTSSSSRDRVNALEMDLPPMDKDTLKELMRHFVQKLSEYDQYDIFAKPVDADLIPGYKQVITQPMDFETMLKNIQNDIYNEYTTFEHDMELVFSNCKKFNPTDTVYYKEANRLHRYYRKWKKDLATEMLQNPDQNILNVFTKVSYLKIKVDKQQLPEPDPIPDQSTQEAEQKELGRTRNNNKRRSDVKDDAQINVAPSAPRVSNQQTMTNELEELIKEDSNQFFLYPVDQTIFTDYKEIIKEPMDWSTMKEKLRLRRYKKFESFINDFERVCNNAMMFNQPDSVVSQEAQRILKLGRDRLGEALKRTKRNQVQSVTASDVSEDHHDKSEEAGLDLSGDERETRSSGPSKRQLKRLLERQKKKTVVDAYTKLNEVGWVPRQYFKKDTSNEHKVCQFPDYRPSVNVVNLFPSHYQNPHSMSHHHHSQQQQPMFHQPMGFVPQGELMQLSHSTGTLTRAPSLQFHSYNPQTSGPWPMVNGAMLSSNPLNLLMMQHGMNGSGQAPVNLANKIVTKKFTRLVDKLSDEEWMKVQTMSLEQCSLENFGSSIPDPGSSTNSHKISDNDLLSSLRDYLPKENIYDLMNDVQMNEGGLIDDNSFLEGIETL
ncbi:transcription initiation factor TFIID subunit 1 [Acrasis kona]|uniref:Transcription initiation factor TFIID subunit 1 n=1 Tax=Acrasis kona TaxID=1008807 RepID=A0AAW2YVD5_9EUKA